MPRMISSVIFDALLTGERKLLSDRAPAALINQTLEGNVQVPVVVELFRHNAPIIRV